MKALSVHSIYASAITCGLKFIELRSWRTSYRGHLLICSTVEDKNNKELKDEFIFGHALAIVDLVDVRPFNESERELAFVSDEEDLTGLYSWELDNIRPIKPIPIKGQQRIFNVDIDENDIEFIDIGSMDEEIDPEDIVLKIAKYWLENGYIKKFPWEE